MQGGEEVRSEAYLDVRCSDERRSQRRRWAFFSTLLAPENPCEPQAAQKGPDARRRGSGERGVLRCTLQRRATKPTPQMGVFQHPEESLTPCSTVTDPVFEVFPKQAFF